MAASPLSCFLLLGLASCAPARSPVTIGWMPAPAPDLGAIVARVSGVPIYAKQVQGQAKQTGLSARDALADLIDDCVAAEGARLLGRSPQIEDPDVQSVLVQRLIEREIEPGLEPKAMPDTAVRPLYEKIRDDFVHPRLVEIGVLAVFTGALMKEEPRKVREDAARELAAYVATHPATDLDDFAALASDAKWSNRNVVYRRMVQGPDEPLPKSIGERILKLRTPGETTPLLSDETGFYIARYISERKAESISFEAAREKLKKAYYPRWSQEQFLRSSSQLAKEHKVEVHFDRITSDEQGR